MSDINLSNGFELGPFHFTVDSTPKSDEDLRSRQKYGECHSALRKICVSKEYGIEQYHATATHEIVEAINDVYCNDKIKHDDINNIGHGLAQVLKSLGLQFVYKETHE